ncbi:streptomycin biosynthesis regulator [Acaryochloris thomasi]|nr:streptomycin biosynthesis regulator [Acaryochloris thomasi]
MSAIQSHPKSRRLEAGTDVSTVQVDWIRIQSIRRDGGTQSRACLDPETLETYRRSLNEGEQFPPVTLFYDGESYWLADGFHRVKAHEVAERKEIAAEVKAGTRRDAILYSAGANATHGLRRSNADKRRVVETLLDDPEWRQWSDREIAARCHVSHPFVGQLRQERQGRKGEPAAPDVSEPSPRLAQRGGKTYTVDVSNIGGSLSSRTRNRHQKPSPAAPLVSVEPPTVKKGETWLLGRRHRLFCGNQSSRKLQALLPAEITLLLLFPSTSEEWLPSLPLEAQSVLAFYSQHLGEIHLETLRNIIYNSLSGTTDAEDTVVMLNLPDPSSFLLIEEMDCSSFCAEPDPSRCREALAAWAVTGQPIHKL